MEDRLETGTTGQKTNRFADDSVCFMHMERNTNGSSSKDRSSSGKTSKPDQHIRVNFPEEDTERTNERIKPLINFNNPREF